MGDTRSSRSALPSGSVRIPSLDGMRAIAVLLVFQAHAFSSYPGDFALILPGIYPLTEALGALGVTTFFFLSGFLITTLLRREYEKTGRISIGSFYLRRIYRLAPPFYILLTLVFILANLGFLSSPMRPIELLAQALQSTNYYLLFDPRAFRAQGTGIMWSLAVEEHFYLIFPLLFLPLLRRYSYHRIAVVLLVVCFIGLVWRWIGYMELGFSRSWLDFATDSRADSILAGCLMGVWRNPLSDGRVVDNQLTGTLLVIACAAMAIGAPLLPLDGAELVLSFSVQSVCLFIFFTLAIQHPDWWCFRMLNWRPLMALGAISYTFYLCHLVIFKLVLYHTSFSAMLAVPLVLLLALAFSTLMYWTIEKRMAKLRRQLHRERTDQATD